jgi:hypothetical protein
MAVKPVFSLSSSSGPQHRNSWWWRLSQRSRGIVAVTVMVAILLAVFGIPLLVLQLSRPTFVGDTSVYAKLQPGPPASGSQVMKVKLVIVDMATGQMDHIWDMMIPDELASKPADVETVVQLQWSKNLIGHYEGGGSAYTSNVDVTVIDVATSNVIGTASFNNQPPALYVGQTGDSVGTKPEDQVIKYLEKLPSNVQQDNRFFVLWFGGIMIGFVVLIWWIFVHAPRKARKRASMGVLGAQPPARRP